MRSIEEKIKSINEKIDYLKKSIDKLNNEKTELYKELNQSKITKIQKYLDNKYVGKIFIDKIHNIIYYINYSNCELISNNKIKQGLVGYSIEIENNNIDVCPYVSLYNYDIKKFNEYDIISKDEVLELIDKYIKLDRNVKPYSIMKYNRFYENEYEMILSEPYKKGELYYGFSYYLEDGLCLSAHKSECILKYKSYQYSNIKNEKITSEEFFKQYDVIIEKIKKIF